jgi:hypothetical protein
LAIFSRQQAVRQKPVTLSIEIPWRCHPASPSISIEKDSFVGGTSVAQGSFVILEGEI